MLSATLLRIRHAGNRAVTMYCAVAMTALIFSSPAAAQFTQQGAKLVGTGAVGAALQGISASQLNGLSIAAQQAFGTIGLDFNSCPGVAVQ